MLSVTVMMFRDIVESVMLLKDEDWRVLRSGREAKNQKSQNGTKVLIKKSAFDL